MIGKFTRAAAAIAALISLGAQAPAPRAAPEVRLYRLDCGAGELEKNFFSDTHAYPDGAKVKVTASCYLIRHGQDLLLWDTGFGKETLGNRDRGLRQPIEPQLASVGVKPEDIGMVGISHSHGDHTGQAAIFPKARLIIGAREFDALFGREAFLAEAGKPLANWADGSNVKKVAGDFDIYGDGSVVVLAMPGHTPGHLGLQLKLKNAGYVILSGDQWHFRENRKLNGVPGFNYDRAETLASSDRMEALLRNLKARLIIQHDPEDNAGLPKLPAYLD